MEEVHRITPLGAEARRDLIGDPHRPIAEGMDLGVRPISANIADKPLKISGEVRCVSFLLPCSTPLSPSILRLKRF